MKKSFFLITILLSLLITIKAKHYMELYGVSSCEVFAMRAFTTEDEETYTLISDPSVKVSREVLIPALREWGTRINELVLASKIKYGEYTKEGLVKIEKPKVLQK